MASRFSKVSPERGANLLVDEDRLIEGRTIVYMSLRAAVGFQDRSDNLTYVATRGCRLDHIATVFYNDPKLFWVLAEYQPNPIFNPMAPVEEGRVIYGPSIEFLQKDILKL